MLLYAQTQAQEVRKDTSLLFKTIWSTDSLLFNFGYNECDTAILDVLISNDFEFYHDQNGILDSKEKLMQATTQLCNMSYKASRVLIDDTMEIFPLYQHGQLYGVIQSGQHAFYGKEKGKDIYLTSTARFTHLWILEDDTWKLKRVLSYDHIVPDYLFGCIVK